MCSFSLHNHVKNEKNRLSHFGEKSKNTIFQHAILYNLGDLMVYYLPAKNQEIPLIGFKEKLFTNY